MALVSWDIIQKPKKLGVLGIRYMVLKNVGLLSSGGSGLQMRIQLYGRS